MPKQKVNKATITETAVQEVKEPVVKAKKVFVVNNNIIHNTTSYSKGQEISSDDIYFLVLHNQGFLTQI